MTAGPDADEMAALDALMRSNMSPRCRVVGVQTVDEAGEYRVLRVELRDPDRAVIVKLCPPGDPRALGFARAAACVRLVRARTGVPTFDLLAVDASGARWPWAYLVASEIEGQRWRKVVPTLEPVEQQELYEQLGRVVAGLQSVRFDAYGEIRVGRAGGPNPTYLDAFTSWARAHILDPEHRVLFVDVLRERADLFADVGPPRLTHEDLNPNNLLVRRDAGGWRLAGVLDFDKAWAGCGESDLARLELWHGMTGPGFWEGYSSILPVPAGYAARRPLYQLLWCLEYARATPQHLADTAAVCKTLGIPPVTFTSANVER